MSHPPLLIDPADALPVINDGTARAVDATFCLAGADATAQAKYHTQRLPHALFFDIEAIADPDAVLPHSMPSAEVFADHMQRLGIGRGDWLIVYDDSGFLSATRAWWMLRYFGHAKVSVLDGGLRAWLAAGGKLETGQPAKNSGGGDFTSRKPTGDKSSGLIGLGEMQQLVATPLAQRRQQIVDARSASRFHGLAPEPREGVESGHMPGATNCPLTGFLDGETGKLKPREVLADTLAQCGIDMTKPIVTTCGSGITACGIAFVLALLGKYDVAMYDGSWSEWGAAIQNRALCPIASSD